MEGIISLSATLFILSMISERIVNYYFITWIRRFTNVKRVLYLCLVGMFLSNSAFAFQGTNSDGQNDPDILDSLIAICIILFLMSTIVEKITQLIRKYAPYIKPYSRFKKYAFGAILASIWRNINRRNPKNDPRLEKRIEREVNSLTLIIGITLALIFRVDLFKMIKATNPKDVLFWNGETPYFTCTWDFLFFVVSILLTGFFLSFGSKFFHDLIDLLFQVKTLKKKSVDENTYNSQSIQELDSYLEAKYVDIIALAIQQNEAIFNKNELAIPPLHGKMMKNGNWTDCIDLHLKVSSTTRFPTEVIAKTGTRTITVPVQIITDVSTPKALIEQGNDVAAENSSHFKGTICCKVKRNNVDQVALVTCSHVMTNGSAKNHFGRLNVPVPALIEGNRAADFVWALRTEKMDVAMLTTEDQHFNYQITPGKPRSLSPGDMMKTKIRVAKRNGIIATGDIINYCSPWPINIEYSEKEYGIAELIVLAKVTANETGNSYESLTVPGDSGACVFDQHGDVIGMIIAGNNKFSYAVAMPNLLKEINASIV